MRKGKRARESESIRRKRGEMRERESEGDQIHNPLVYLPITYQSKTKKYGRDV